MDPTAAIGLAANVVQFVDFSWKLFRDTKDLYDSSTGASADHDILELIITDLAAFNDKLTAPTAPGAIPDSMRNLASQCIYVIAELRDILNKIRVQGPRKKWKSFVQALRSIWKKDQIDNLVKRLEALRSEIQFHLQLIIR